MKTSKSKVLRKAWPKVRPYVKHGKTYYVIDLRRKHYTGPKLKWLADREAALRFAADIRLKMPVVIKCKFTSPISLCFFLVCRRAHLSQYRLKHGQFNESELARITKALGDMSAVKFRIYDARQTNVNLNLDDDESHIVISM